LGAILREGVGALPPYEEMLASGIGFTDVDQAAEFVTLSGCDWLSVAVGNLHGAVSRAYRDQKKTAARLDLDHLARLRDATGVPLVLHGGSSIVRDYVLRAIDVGIAKINVATEIRQAYEQGLKAGGTLDAAKQAVYDRTSWYLRDYLGIAGLHDRVQAGT
jgi:fructose/tagatose bisphosphate aldolase